jgi:hypothetical protein
MITTGGPTSPAKAAMPPAMPRKRDPNTMVKLTMFGPGRKWHSAKVSLNSSAVIQLVLIDDAAPRPHQHAAETRERHFGERDKQRGQAGRS